jgi:hypothetical protein
MEGANQRSRRRIGRPPAGARAGEKVKDYPQLSVRIPLEARLLVGALSVLQVKPQWRIVLESIECLRRSLSESEQQRVEELIKRRIVT